jgi:hypothetical protein
LQYKPWGLSQPEQKLDLALLLVYCSQVFRVHFHLHRYSSKRLVSKMNCEDAAHMMRFLGQLVVQLQQVALLLSVELGSHLRHR